MYIKNSVKHITAAVIALLITMVWCACGKNAHIRNEGQAEKQKVLIHADEPLYNSIESLAKQTDYIVLGEIVSKRCEARNLRVPNENDKIEDIALDESTAVTIYEVKVVNSYTPDPPLGMVLELMVLGGEYETTSYILEDAPKLLVGNEYVFFLTKSQLFKNGVWLTNNSQSAYIVDHERISSVCNSGFDFTINELAKLHEDRD